MTRMHSQLPLALALSLLLHALPFLPAFPGPAKAPRRPSVLEAHLQLPPPVAEQPPLLLPPPETSESEPPRQPPKPTEKPIQKPLRKPVDKPIEQPVAKPAPTSKASPGHWTSEVKKQLGELDRQGKFYPAEAIAQGLEGEALVLLFLDEAGNPAAARIEQSSGHRILDEAALRAVRSLHSLPAAAPRETLLPVRFRLR